MLKGKVIIVTGGGSGIGRAAALLFAGDGARVMVADIDGVKAEGTAREIAANSGEVHALACDISDEASVRTMVANAVNRFGRLDAAFNNAGVEFHGKLLPDLEVDEWARVRAVNLDGVFYCMKHEIAAMRQSGGGAIVNTASVAAVTSQMGMADYSGTKAGVTGITRAAAAEFGQTGVRVNAVLPGIIRTPMTEERLFNNPETQAVLAPLLDRHSLGRFGEPEDVAQAARWLLSDLAAYVNGVSLPVDGGYTAR